MLFNFLNKLYTRFVAPSPIAFKIVNWICNLCLVIGAVQELIELFPVTIPEPYNYFMNKTFLIAAGIIRLSSGMTVKKPTNEK